MLIHYLVKDEPQASRFQSGLFNIAGRPKLAALAFPLPIAQAGRSGGKLVLWGQVRPRSGVQSYRVQVLRRRRPVALQRRAAQHERARLLQRAGGGAGGRERPHPLAAGRRLQRHDPRPLDARAQLRSERARATCPPRRPRLPSCVARDGLFLCACGIVLLLESELGLPPWDVLNQGISRAHGLSFGAANIVVSVVVLVLAWRARSASIGLGTRRERDPDRLVRRSPCTAIDAVDALSEERSASGSG